MRFDENLVAIHSYLCADGYFIRNKSPLQQKSYRIGLRNQKIDAPPRLKSHGLIGARFIKNILVFECHRNVGALRDLDVKKNYVFWMIDMLCMIDTRNFCTEVCHVKVCLKNTLNTSKLLIVAICCATNSFMVEFVCIQKSSRRYKKGLFDCEQTSCARSVPHTKVCGFQTLRHEENLQKFSAFLKELFEINFIKIHESRNGLGAKYFELSINRAEEVKKLINNNLISKEQLIKMKSIKI